MRNLRHPSRDVKSPKETTLRDQAENGAKPHSERVELLQQQEKGKVCPEVKLLLLGQSESGKSTMIKRESSFRSGVVPCPGFAMRTDLPGRFSVGVFIVVFIHRVTSTTHAITRGATTGRVHEFLKIPLPTLNTTLLTSLIFCISS